ncbi:hypothetical protein C7G42_16615 [Bradyrhizobium sp. MOS003]|nr:hypothetical protein C7G42_16615 [Bradyrhizobium sp. MOS003]
MRQAAGVLQMQSSESELEIAIAGNKRFAVDQILLGIVDDSLSVDPLDKARDRLLASDFLDLLLEPQQ